MCLSPIASFVGKNPLSLISPVAGIMGALNKKKKSATPSSTPMTTPGVVGPSPSGYGG